MHFNGETMKYLNTGLVCEQSGLSCVELPKICIPVYREVIKEMAEVIKDSQMRDVFYSLSTGIDILAVSKKTGVTPRNLAYMYNPQIQISAESETKRSIFREKDKTKRSKKESAQHSKSRNKSFVMTSVSAL